MSNIVTIQPTKFENVPSGDPSCGVRIFDDYSQTYQNNWEYVPNDDLEIIQLTIQNANDDTKDFLLFIKENQHGLYVGNQWYDYHQFQHLLEPKKTG
jgi:hypothetical protein